MRASPAKARERRMTPKQNTNGTWDVVDAYGSLWAVNLTYKQALRYIDLEAQYTVDRGEDVHDWALRMGGDNG